MIIRYSRVGYEFHENCFVLWLTLDSMSMANAEKSVEYTQISFIRSKHWANIKQLWALEILKYK